jgi:outer membrane protein OmpA-like peptidoglycan-associated protein/chemotaxis signal transduction protein
MHVGLIVDAKEGEVDPARMPVRELPPVARSEGWSNALVGDGKIYPLVDLYGLIDDPGKKKAGGVFKDLYIPSSDFPSLFLNEVVDIMEFEFRGNCYGLPREEVIECFSYKEYCRFPGLPVMMPGLLFYNDELLPVLDLALWSGEGLDSAGYRDMLLLVNGNLRLVIATEKVCDWKRIEKERQREYRHLFVYGCYREEKLKIILNIHAMLTHFDEVEFTLGESRKAKGAILPPDEEKGVPEEGPEPEEPVEAAAEDSDEIKEMPQSRDAVPCIEREVPPVKNEKIAGKGGSVRPDSISGKKPVELKKDQMPDTEVMQSPVEREAPAGNKEEPEWKTIPATEEKITTPVMGEEAEKKTSPAPEDKTFVPEEMNEGPAAADGKKALLIILVAFFALITGLLYTFFFKENIHKNADLKEETKTGIRKQVETVPGGSRFILSEDERKIIFSHILFPADSATLLSSEIQKLEGISSILVSHRGNEVRIAGHTARFGTEAGRKFLSGARARAVGKYLVSTGSCTKEQLRYRNMGSAIPVGDNSFPEGRKKNRRVEIILLKE